MNKFYEGRDLWIEKAIYKEQPLIRNSGIPFIETLPLRMDRPRLLRSDRKTNSL